MFGKWLMTLPLVLGLALLPLDGADGTARAATKTTFKKLNFKNSKGKSRADAQRAQKAGKSTLFANAGKGKRKAARRAGLKRKANFSARKPQSAAARRGHVGKRLAFLGGGKTKSVFARKEGQIYSGGRYLGKTEVKFIRKLKPGTILVKTRERALYFVLPGGKAIKYGVGVGRQGFTWSGRHRITMKKEWPEWRPPEEMKKRELAKYGRKLPDVMPGGPKNPLGARALYIGNTLYRIHGTNNPRSIGKFVSSGCIRMVNEEVIDLYKRVKIGAPVIVED